MNIPSIIIATPHERHDALEKKLHKTLRDYRIIRLSAKEGLTLQNIAKINPDLIFFPHWSWLIPKEIYTRYECIIFHMTDVPYGRGGSPLQNLIVRGHKETKLTALKCASKLDAGPVYMKCDLPLDGTAEDILNRSSRLMEKMIVKIIEEKPRPRHQKGKVVEFKRRLPKDGNLGKLSNIDKAYDYIRMLDANGYPRAFLNAHHLTFEFAEARLEKDFVEAKVRIKKRIQ